MSDLPSGWAWAKLDDILAVGKRPITDGPFGSKLATRHYAASGARVIRLQNIGDGFFRDEMAFISKEYFEELQDHDVWPGDLLVASLGEQLPRACIAPDLGTPAIVKADCIRARIHPYIDVRWVLFALMAPPTRSWATSRIKGVGRPRLGMAGVRQIPIPIPPLVEQRRIVAIVERHLSNIAHGSSALNKAVLRAAFLKRSVMDLVASGRILCKTTHNNPHEELASGWRWATPEELTSGYRSDITIGPFGSDLKVTDYTDSGIPLIFVRDIRSGNFGVKNPRFVSIQKANALRAHKARKGDILITKMGDPPGDACVYSADEDGVITADCIRFRPGQSWNPEYLAIAINSSLVRRQIKQITRGVAQQKISLARFRQEVRIPVPPIELQHSALEEGGRYISAIGNLEASLAIANQRREALRRSLFAEAFAGRLVEQDSADEPASVLLERIQAEQAALGPARRSRQRLREMSSQGEALF